MSKTKIPWVKNPDGTQGYTLNPISGCLNRTPEGLCLGGLFPCYAYKLANGRLKSRYMANHNYAISPPVAGHGELYRMYLRHAEADPFYPRFWEDRVFDSWSHFINLGSKPKGIFVCDMSDLFGIGIPPMWQDDIFTFIKLNPIHRFYLLTKQPQNLPQWSPFPDNCWVGVTVTKPKFLIPALDAFDSIQCSVRYLSIEPMLATFAIPDFDIPDLSVLLEGSVDWVIIGSCTGNKKDMLALIERYPDLTLMPFGKKWTAQPKIEWVEWVVKVCDKAGVQVFLKNNLMPLLTQEGWGNDIFWGNSTGRLRQEMPSER